VGTVTPGPTRASGETIAPGSIVAPSISALAPIETGLLDSTYEPIVLGPMILAPKPITTELPIRTSGD
jgi:hypothetical protein